MGSISSPEQQQRPDGEILAEVIAGDHDQYACIVNRYRGALLQLAFSYLGDKQTAEDAVQEAFLNSFRWLDTYDSRYSFRTWLWRILLNVCHRTHAKSRRTPVPASKISPEQPYSLVEPDADDPGMLEQLIRQEQASNLASLLERVTETNREAVRLRFFGGMKFQEIARAQEITLPAAKARVRNGLLQLAKLIRNHCQELSEEGVAR